MVPVHIEPMAIILNAFANLTIHSINQSINNFYSGLSGVTVKKMSHDNVWEWLLEQCVFQWLPESRQRIG